MEKPLVIKVKPASIPNGTPGKWEDLSGNIEKFTADIETPAIDENSDISAQVSGIPTAYARANLFKSALQSYRKALTSTSMPSTRCCLPSGVASSLVSLSTIAE